MSNISETTLITDQFSEYKIMATVMEQLTISHTGRFVEGVEHTNTIEGSWSQLNRAWFGQHHYYSRIHMPLYISEACWKFNKRYEKPSDTFDRFLHSAVLST